MVQYEINEKQHVKPSRFRSSEEKSTRRRQRAMLIPAANVDETREEYFLTVASPGFRRENFRVMIENDLLIITAAREPVIEKCKHDRREYDYTRWKRSFLLPDDAEALLSRAWYKAGELIIRIPRGKTEKITGQATIHVY